MSDETFYTDAEVYREGAGDDAPAYSKMSKQRVHWTTEKNFTFPLGKFRLAVADWLRSNDIGTYGSAYY